MNSQSTQKVGMVAHMCNGNEPMVRHEAEIGIFLQAYTPASLVCAVANVNKKASFLTT